jgi:hypothetical protein
MNKKDYSFIGTGWLGLVPDYKNCSAISKETKWIKVK